MAACEQFGGNRHGNITEKKTVLLSRPRVTAGLAVGLRARVLPTKKFPPLAPLKRKTQARDPTARPEDAGGIERQLIKWFRITLRVQILIRISLRQLA